MLGGRLRRSPLRSGLVDQAEGDEVRHRVNFASRSSRSGRCGRCADVRGIPRRCRKCRHKISKRGGDSGRSRGHTSWSFFFSSAENGPFSAQFLFNFASVGQ
jgi:hypothetical protein